MNRPYAVIGESADPITGQLKQQAEPAPAAVPPGLLWRLPTVLQQFPTSRRDWYRGVAAGHYPSPVKLTDHGRAVAWRAADVMQLVHSRLSSGG